MMRAYPLVVLFMFNLLGAYANDVPQLGLPQQKPRMLNAAILIFNGVQIIDYTGPYETFGHAYNNEEPLFNIYTVATSTKPITTAMGMSVNPRYSLRDAPKPDVLLVPGGSIGAALNDQDAIKWVQDQSKSTKITMSVCNGAFILAKAGLLDGLEATTTFGLIDKLRQAAPKAKVVDNKRYVDNGRVVTAAGLSSGIDCSLHIIERFFGKGTAQMAALGMEYNWDPNSRFVRASLADKYMQFDFNVKVLPGGWVPLVRDGDVNHWQNKWAITTDCSDAEVLESVNRTIISGQVVLGAPQVKWIRREGSTVNPLQSLWQFTDENDNVWKGFVQLERNVENQKQFTLTVEVDRDDRASSL
jgi:putative intracellular protease/amidase